MSNIFKRDTNLQELFNIICIEGREEELREESDIYHFGFSSPREALDFGFNLGEFMGQYHFGELVYEFDVPESNAQMYFIGSYEEVKTKIRDIL